jgi:hypothetical protein
MEFVLQVKSSSTHEKGSGKLPSYFYLMCFLVLYTTHTASGN